MDVLGKRRKIGLSLLFALLSFWSLKTRRSPALGLICDLSVCCAQTGPMVSSSHGSPGRCAGGHGHSEGLLLVFGTLGIVFKCL